MKKNLEFWRKFGLSFEILGVLAKLSFGENVEKKPDVKTSFLNDDLCRGMETGQQCWQGSRSANLQSDPRSMLVGPTGS